MSLKYSNDGVVWNMASGPFVYLAMYIQGEIEVFKPLGFYPAMHVIKT